MQVANIKRGLFTSLLTAIALLLFSFSGTSQTLLIEGQIIDSESSLPLPFAHIYIKNQKNSLSTSDMEGYFSIVIQKGDELAVSFIGYEEYTKTLSESDTNLIIQLKPFAVQLSEVKIEEESQFLYALVARSKKSATPYTSTSRTYLFHRSSVKEKTVEIVEAYYNGRYRAYDLEELEMKNGRIGLQVFGEQYLINMQSSRAIVLHQLMADKSYFPTSPLGKKKGKLKRLFELSYENSFEDEKKRKVYVIRYEPRSDEGRYFSGRIWMDSASASLLKIEMKAENSKAHPFLPAYPDDEITKVDLYLNKSFQPINGEYYPEDFNFIYNIEYRNRKGDTTAVNCQSLLYAFDYYQPFILPFFKFPFELDNDYRKINAIPLNREFWQNKPFALSDHDGKIQRFFRSPNTTRAKGAQIGWSKRQSFFEHPYVIWNGNRIRMKESIPEEKKTIKLESHIESDRYQLEVQLFLDINEFADTLHYTTAAIFDPFESYYFYEQDAVSAVFMNVYFDLAEIEKRKLDLQLKGINDIDKAKEVFFQRRLGFEELSSQYFNEVMRGKDLSALRSWNDLVRKELGIDNFEIFRLDDPDF